MRIWWVLALVATCGLTACAGGGNNVVSPVSQQVSGTDQRSRARVHTELGFAYYEAKNLPSALDEARVALGIDSDYALAYNLLGLINLELKDNAKAESAFLRALDLAPADPDISNNYGWFLCETGQYAKAMANFETALRNPLYATPTLTLNNAAQCASRNGDDALAETYLLRSVKLDPGNTRSLYQLAELNYRMGRYGDARTRLGELLRKTDLTASIAWLGLRIARKTGDRGEEARYYAQLRQRFPDSNEMNLLSQGRYE